MGGGSKYTTTPSPPPPHRHHHHRRRRRHHHHHQYRCPHLVSVGYIQNQPTIVCLLVGCLTSQQHASVSQGRIRIDNFTCCHTEIEAADPTFHLTQSRYTDTGPTSPSADPITPGAWQGSHWKCQCLSHWYDSTPKKIPAQARFEPGTFRSGGGRLNH